MIKVYQLNWSDEATSDRRMCVHYPVENPGGLVAIVGEHWKAGRYALVAEVVSPKDEGDDPSLWGEPALLEDAWERTNTCGLPWWENARVTRRFAGNGCRSTSIGDVMEFPDGRRFVADAHGFREIFGLKA